MNKRICIGVGGLVLCGLLFAFGRGLWHPVYVKVFGGKEIGEIVQEFEEQSSFDHDIDHWVFLHLLCFKEERVIEVWAEDQEENLAMVREFPFTGFSGELGPKLSEGDGQIPEGVYEIEYLNPNSSYHLSMKLSYPNAFDREKGLQDQREKLGFDILIHGKSVTVGCIPIGDEGIEELFYMVAKVGVEKVNVVVSPYDMRKGKKDLEIAEIDWEDELYEQIDEALSGFVAVSDDSRLEE